MAAKYDFKTSPDIQGEKEQPTLYPQIVVSGTKNGSPDKPGGLSIQLCKSEKKEFYIRYSS